MCGEHSKAPPRGLLVRAIPSHRRQFEQLGLRDRKQNGTHPGTIRLCTLFVYSFG